MTKKTFPSQYLVTCHTDHCGPGSTFVAIKGMQDDGIHYIEKALSLGATTIVIDQTVTLPAAISKIIAEKKVALVKVRNTRKTLAELSAQANEYPSSNLRIIGVTGTKGKTTTTFLIEHILRTAGFKTALMSTVKNSILDENFEAHLTTPQPDYLHTFFTVCREKGVEFVVMEVAAQALSLHRVDTIEFDAAVFTNFSLEHSEFYAHQDDYFKSKTLLFEQLAVHGYALFNADDERVKAYAKCVPQSMLFGIRNSSELTGTIEQSNLNALKMQVASKKNSYHIEVAALLGAFNASNILAAVGVVEKYDIPVSVIENAISTFDGVPGRLQRFNLPNKAVAFIDNAHTPSSFEALLSALRPLSSHIIAVFGAGGDRDVLKRPLMGAIAASYADEVVLTTDNPRSEDPQVITQQIYQGIDNKNLYKVRCELDREEAIHCAYALSKPGSIIVLLGKGPVEYQHIKEKKIPFSETSILRSLVNDAIIT